MRDITAQLDDETFLIMLESQLKPEGGGENPYLFIAKQIGIYEKLLEQIVIYVKTPEEPEEAKVLAYQALINWEVREYPIAFQKIYGRLPVKGNLEALLPESKVTPQAAELIPQLTKNGIKIAIVSSGFQTLVAPAAAELGIDEIHVHANSFVYDDETNLVKGIDVQVSGNKINAIGKAIKIFQVQSVDATNIAYVGDNNWDKGAIKHVLALGGKIFYLRPYGNEDLKDFPLDEPELLNNENVTIIHDLLEISQHCDSLTAIIFDADGTIINT